MTWEEDNRNLTKAGLIAKRMEQLAIEKAKALTREAVERKECFDKFCFAYCGDDACNCSGGYFQKEFINQLKILQETK